MNNKTAIIVAFFVIAAFVADQAFTGGTVRLFLAKKFLNLIEYLAFWR